MEVTEVSAEGLERKFNVKVPASELDEKLVAKLNEIKGQVHLKGFRKGKAPVSFLKKMYGKNMMGEIVQEMISETSRKAFADRELTPATDPRPDFKTALDQVIAGEADLDYDLEAEILPTFEPADVSAYELTKPIADVPAEDVDEALNNIAEGQTTYADKEDGAAAEDKDMVLIDFLGKLDGEPFEGGEGKDQELVLGAGRFIPGFEEQLVGVKAGDEKVINVTFPEDYTAEDLAGKETTFDITVKAVKAPEVPTLDDELAKKVGLDDLGALRERLEERLQGEFSQQSRAHIKRALLDKLDDAHDFDLPKGMVDQEFDQIWRQIENAERDEEDKDKSEEELKEEYRKIAERRVRLGLVLAEIGKRAEVDVPANELQQAIQGQAVREAQMMQMQGQNISPQEVLKFYQQNPGVVAQIRAPLFEEKVVDYILERATVTEKTVSKEELMKDPEGDI
ncbi:MAG: trigger factor [Pseudomonadota bacterium]